jgi:hypothetical protein
VSPEDYRGGERGMYLGIDDKYQSTHFTENRVEVKGRFKEVDLAWKVPYLKVDERTKSATSTKNACDGRLLYVVFGDFGC